MKNLQVVQVGDDWYNVAQDRGIWRSDSRQSLVQHQEIQQREERNCEKNVQCDVCGQCFWVRR